MVNWTIDQSGMYLFNAINLLFAVFLSFYFSVFNIAIFLTSCCMDKKFIVLWHASPPSKTAWENVLSVAGGCSQFFSLISFLLFFAILSTTEVEG